MTYGLTHLAVAISDISRTLNFYQLVFDMEVMYLTEDMLQLTTPGCNDIMVFERRDLDLLGQTGGIAHFGFRLRRPDDIDTILERLRKINAIVVEQGEFVPGSPYVFFKDPDGYVIEVWYEFIPPSSN